LAKTSKLLKLIKKYSGCEDVIREALSNPGNTEVEKNAFDGVSAAVDVLYKFYDFAQKIDKIWETMLGQINTEEFEVVIGNQQAIIKQMAEIFHFVFEFDNEKIIHPSIQNDFAYYRRVYHRMKSSGSTKKKKGKVDEDIANKMSFFFAYPTPLMKVLIDCTTKAEKENLISALSYLANACTKGLIDIEQQYRETLKADIEGDNDHNAMLFLCTMAGCIILVDHLDQNGAFHSKSEIKIKIAVETLINYSTEYITRSVFLINSLRFTTLHLNDEQTIAAVKRALNPQ